MPKKRFTVEQIIEKMREAEVKIGPGLRSRVPHKRPLPWREDWPP